MTKDYTDVITEVCQLLFNAICSRESNLVDKVQILDGEIFKLLRLIGLQQSVDALELQLVHQLTSTGAAFCKPVLKRSCSNQHHSQFN